MATIFMALLPLVIVFALSMIGPLIIILKWHRRPVWAMVTASVVYVLPVFLLSLFSIFTGFQNTEDPYFYASFIVFIGIWLILGLIFLVPIQWKNRKTRARREHMKIENTF